MEDRYVRNVGGGWTKRKGRGSGECWVLFVEEEKANEVIKVYLTDVLAECLE